MNPVSVTTTLLKLATVVGVNVMVTFPLLLPAAEAGAAAAKVTLKAPKLGVTAGRVPEAVVSKTVLEAIVAAATVVDAACGVLGLMMLLHVKDACVPAVRVPAVKVTVNRSDARVAVAAGMLVTPTKSPTTIVAVDVNPVSVTTTLLKVTTEVGVNVMVTFPLFVAADAEAAAAKVTLKAPKLGVTAGRVPAAVVSKITCGFALFSVAAAMVVDATCGALGLTMLLTVNDAVVPATRVPTVVKVTVNTLEANTAPAATDKPVIPATKITVGVLWAT